jgi:putative ABC transport system permease protein
MIPSRSGVGRLYEWLIRAYPAHFRARFEHGMRDSFQKDFDSARLRGRTAVICFLMLTAVDLLRFGLAEHFQATPHVPAEAPSGDMMKSLLATDLRDAWRSLRATPVVTAVAVLSLALGIGANTALFSILNSLVLKSLPVRDPAQLALLENGDWTNPIWEALRAHEHQIGEGAFAWSATRFDLADGSETDFVPGAWISGRMFDVLGVRALRGRTITEADDVRGGGPQGPVAMISHALWQRRFGGAEDIVGRSIHVERVPFTIAGVMPQGFFGPDVGRTVDVVIPLGAEPLVRGAESVLDQRSNWWLSVMFRLRAGEAIDDARARLRVLQPQIRTATIPTNWPAAEQAHYLTDAFSLSPAATGQSFLRQRYVTPLVVVLTVVGLVLLIACANIASLLLARAMARRHELSVRLALGASRFRLARQLLAESVMMAAGGAVLALVFAHWASRALVSQLTALTSQVSLDLALDWRVLAFTTAVTCGTVLLFGLAPAFGVSTIAPLDALKEQGRSVAGGRRLTLRHALVVLQVALSLTLVVGALLFARTFATLVTRDAGFDRDLVLIVDVNAARSASPLDRRAELFEQLRESVAAVPGVAGAAASFTTPTGGSGWNMDVRVPPGSTLTRRQRMTWVNAVSPDWFATYGIRLVAGRDVSATDSPTGPKLALVNRAFAKRFLKEGNPVGQQFLPGTPSNASETYEVIGLVEDAVYRSLRAEMEPVIYIPLTQWERPGSEVTLSVRSAGAPPLALARSVASALTSVDPRITLSYHSLNAQVGSTLIRERLLSNLSMFFGGLALLLAGLGLYGVTSYSVNTRRTEMGIRLALGADPAVVVRLVLRRVAWLVLIGVAAGTALSIWAAGFVASLLYGLQPRDPITLATAAGLLALVGTLAGWVSARRAARTDPTVVLRES